MAENRSCLLDMGLVKSCGDDGPELVAPTYFQRVYGDLFIVELFHHP